MNQGNKQRITELELKNSLMLRSPDNIMKIKQRLLSQKKSQRILKIWMEIILDECLELSKLREAFKMKAQLQEAVLDGIDEEETTRRTKQIELLAKNMDESNHMLFAFFQQNKQQVIRFNDTFEFDQSTINIYQSPLEDHQDSEISKILHNQSFKKPLAENEKVSKDLMAQLAKCLAYDEENKKKIILLENQKKASEAQIERLKNLLNNHKAKNDQLTVKYAQLTRLHQFCKENKDNVERWREIERLYKNLEITSNKFELELRDVKYDLAKEKSKRQECESQLKRQQDKNNMEKCKLVNEIQQLKKLNSSLKLQITQVRKRQTEAIRKNQQLVVNKMDNYRDYERYFAHEVLYDCVQYKQAIIYTLEKRYQKAVKATKLLFRFDLLNKASFHNYIDNIPDILLVIKLQNGRILACYTKQAFEPQCKGEDVFIMVLNTGNIYELKKGQRGIAYDQKFILFGNGQIRLSQKEKKVYSNFGNHHWRPSFDNKRDNIDSLFGEGHNTREVPISGYEIYQIIYEEYSLKHDNPFYS